MKPPEWRFYYTRKEGTTIGKTKRVVNSGYGDAGASSTKKALKGFVATSGSAREDIDIYNATMRQRGRIMYMAAPLATSAIRTNRTNVIGNGLRLKSRINRQMLGISQDDADAWEKRTEAEFELWASRKQACDATGVNDFYAMQQLAMMGWLMSGDCFALVKRVPRTTMLPYSLRLHIIEADRISTPSKPGIAAYSTVESEAENGNKIFDGVEVNSFGGVEAYYICNNYPDNAKIYGDTKTTWDRVLAYGELTGLPNVLQIMDTERPDQYRGVSYLAHVIEPLLQLRRYTESELMAAVVESFFTAFIKTEAATDGVPFNEVDPDNKVSSDPNDYEMGPGAVNVMNPGESVEFADPKRPSSGFSNFVRSITEQVGASLEVPADLLLKAFNASYSASRAALLEAWKAFKMRREWFVSDFCRPAYELWLSEAVALGRVEAPGYFTDPLIHAAWLGSEWIGPSQGQLDPVKEITAELLAISEGISTHEQSTVKINGGAWDSNVDQLEQENKRLSGALIAKEVIAQVVKQTITEAATSGNEGNKNATEN